MTKVDQYGETLSGAVFELRDDSDQLIRTDLISDEQGLVEVGQLAPGSYRFVEVEAPAGFIIDTETDLTFDVQAAEKGEIPVVNLGQVVNYQGRAQLVKTDQHGERLADAQFELRNASGDTVITDLTSNRQGILFMEELAPGDYTLIETEAPAGFILNETAVEFTVGETAAGEPDVIDLGDFINYQNRVIFSKQDENASPLADARFALESSEGEVIEELTSDSEGQVLSSWLAPGDYTIREVNAPTGFIRNTDTFSFTIETTHLGQPEQLDLGSFENVQGSVQFQKITSQGEALSDPVFSLYRD
ncbi:MSCRAMM family protein, partial [Alkalibacterium sp. AK22]|uniref:MSCRAMM family protein n=1 Tax=Alkalibacterium sp. AK22 TaxID=1229520 RepID=UPI0022AE9F3E